MFKLIKEIFVGLLTSLVNGSNHTKCISLSNQKCMIHSTLINLHPNEYNHEFHYYPFAVKLDRCVGSCNTLNDLSNKVCIPNKTENLNLSVFNMITGINASKTLTKHISCKCKCRFDGKKCSSNQWWNNDKCRCECKTHHICEKDYVWNSATCNCENGKYLACIIDGSGIIYDEIIDVKETNLNEKYITCKTQNFYILLAFLLIIIALLITVSIYCYLIKYQAKNVLPFYNTNNKLNTFCIESIN